MRSIKTSFIILIITILFLFGCTQSDLCGNGICESNETIYSCAQDCVYEKGTSLLNNNEVDGLVNNYLNSNIIPIKDYFVAEGICEENCDELIQAINTCQLGECETLKEEIINSDYCQDNNCSQILASINEYNCNQVIDNLDSFNCSLIEYTKEKVKLGLESINFCTECNILMNYIEECENGDCENLENLLPTIDYCKNGDCEKLTIDINNYKNGTINSLYQIFGEFSCETIKISPQTKNCEKIIDFVGEYINLEKYQPDTNQDPDTNQPYINPDTNQPYTDPDTNQPYTDPDTNQPYTNPDNSSGTNNSNVTGGHTVVSGGPRKTIVEEIIDDVEDNKRGFLEENPSDDKQVINGNINEDNNDEKNIDINEEFMINGQNNDQILMMITIIIIIILLIVGGIFIKKKILDKDTDDSLENTQTNNLGNTQNIPQRNNPNNFKNNPINKNNKDLNQDNPLDELKNTDFQ